jgi:hypothetical protein
MTLVNAGLPKELANLIAKLQSIHLHNWRGNHPPDRKHFDSVDRFACGAHADRKTLWCEFDYTEAAVKHTLSVETDWKRFGKRGASVNVLLDGQAVPTSPAQEFIFKPDWVGVQPVFIFKFYFGQAQPKGLPTTRFDASI